MRELRRVVIHAGFISLIAINSLAGFARGQEYRMDSSSVVTCGGVFTDSGGTGSPYSNNESFTKTFIPGSPGGRIVLDFTAFDVDGTSGGACADELRIYDGPTTLDSLIGAYCGTGVGAGPGEVVSSHSLGVLTVEFVSDGSTQSSGWEAQLSCLLYDESIDGDTDPGGNGVDLGTLAQGVYSVIGEIDATSPVFAEWDDEDGYLFRVSGGARLAHMALDTQQSAGGMNHVLVRTSPPAASGWTPLETVDVPSFGAASFEYEFVPYDVGGEQVNILPFTARGSEFGYKVVIEIEPTPYPNHCNGDGGDQMGCTDCPCGNNAMVGLVGGCAHHFSGSGGAGSRLLASGDPSVSLAPGSTTDLEFEAMRLPPSSTAVLFSGAAIAPQDIANPCFGMGVSVGLANPGAKDGLRCATAGLLRHGNRQSRTSGSIGGATGPSRSWGGASGPLAGVAGQSGFVAGQTRYFQITHRDLAVGLCMTGLNTSQAIEVTFLP